MFLEYEKCIAKITSIDTNVEDNIISLRKFSLGNTEEGYNYQQKIGQIYLLKSINEGTVKIIPWDDVLKILFFVIKKKVIK